MTPIVMRRVLITVLVVGVVVALRWSIISDLVMHDRTVLWQAVLAGIVLGSVYGLVSMGLSLIFGVLGIINFAHGSIVGVGFYLSYFLVSRAGIDPYLSVPLTAIGLFLVGAFIQRTMVSRTMGQPLENQLLLTVGLSIVIQNGLLLLFSPTPRSIHVGYVNTNVEILGATTTVARLVAFAAALVLGLLVWVLLRSTRLGTAIRAVSQNSRGAALMGINVDRIYIIAFALGTACAGAAAALILPFGSIEPLSGESFTIIAFITVVLGGLGNITGALYAGLLIGVTYEIGGLLLPGQDKLLLVFGMFVLVLLLRPQGLMGRSGR